MLKGLGLAFLSLIFGASVSAISHTLNSSFPSEYATNHSVEVLATILALNIATATFLVGGLLNIEERVGKDVFEGARREIKHNIFAMAILFGLNVFIAAMVSNDGRTLLNTNITLKDFFSSISLAILFFYVYLLLEIITSSFKIRAPKK